MPKCPNHARSHGSTSLNPAPLVSRFNFDTVIELLLICLLCSMLHFAYAHFQKLNFSWCTIGVVYHWCGVPLVWCGFRKNFIVLMKSSMVRCGFDQKPHCVYHWKPWQNRHRNCWCRRTRSQSLPWTNIRSPPTSSRLSFNKVAVALIKKEVYLTGTIGFGLARRNGWLEWRLFSHG